MVDTRNRAIKRAAAPLQTSDPYRRTDEQKENKCVVIVFYTEKGGTGKTTAAAHVAASLVKKGYKVLIEDADAQMSQTSFWYPDEPPKKEESEDEDDEIDDEAELSPSEELLQAGRKALYKKFTKNNIGATFSGLPAVKAEGRYLSNALMPDVMLEMMNNVISSEDGSKLPYGSDNLLAGLYFVADRIGCRLPEPIECNPDEYHGKLLLLPGHPKLLEFNKHLKSVKNDINYTDMRYMSSLTNLHVALAEVHQLDFIIVDMGPHSDRLHEMIVTSCDFIQPVVDASIYSLNAAVGMLTYRLPGWLQHHRKLVKFQSNWDFQHQTEYNLIEEFPRILPALAMKYSINKGTRRTRANSDLISWNASNAFASIECAFYSDGVPEKVKDKYLPVLYPARGFNKRQSATMLIPAMKTLSISMYVSQETGHPIFDLGDKQIKNYYQDDEVQVNEYRPVIDEEKQYVKKKFEEIANVYRAVFDKYAKECFCQKRDPLWNLLPRGTDSSVEKKLKTLS